MLRYARLLSSNAFMARQIPQKPLLVVLGATGTGKSQLAVELAQRFNGEIINGDAMQMYKGLPIVTNKITIEEQQGIPHHLLGFIGLDEEAWRVTMFKKRAKEIIREIRSRGRIPILVGGTHYYLQGLLFKRSSIESEDESEAEEISHEELLERFPILNDFTETMMDKLKEVDPVMAERWHPNDRRKIQRSLMIYLQTGKRASDVYAEQKKPKDEFAIEDDSPTDLATDLASTLLFWVHSEREALNSRLNARVHKMVEVGLEDEVLSMERFRQSQQNKGLTVDQSRGIWVSIGWKEFHEYLAALDFVTTSEAELKALRNLSVEKTQNATRQYAKRQVQWIRHKLIPALAEETALDKLYLVDSTDVGRWQEDVSGPAIDIAGQFLNGLSIQRPEELSPAAKENLILKKDATDGTLVRRKCTICNTVVVSEKQWETHLQSRRHRGLTRKARKNTELESYLCQQDGISLGATP